MAVSVPVNRLFRGSLRQAPEAPDTDETTPRRKLGGLPLGGLLAMSADAQGCKRSSWNFKALRPRQFFEDRPAPEREALSMGDRPPSQRRPANFLADPRAAEWRTRI